ncbi:hypothetical protein [Cytobacillus sp. BC1816]|uniref:hypothetical protein n=1 Tax=Cytobacillus sp. BC1816 TaxID=3440154 RepID=UPI003F50DE94
MILRFSLYLDDYETEKIFFCLNWILLESAALLFYLPSFSDNSESFPILFSFGDLYMTAAPIALHKMNSSPKGFSIITNAGIDFDYIAFLGSSFHPAVYLAL